MSISSSRVIGVILLIVFFSGIMVSTDVLGRRVLGVGGSGGGGGGGVSIGIGIGGSIDHVGSIGIGIGGGLFGGVGKGVGGSGH
ncbi:hypothetical protein R3W88_030810 [Solanum pinnatisectum]|uniref:Glycine-rich protein n=1 Tax=Solanum pinnatisectum TaxID=50273 RepID=A0AAV9LKP8_9SOLN|nr:hypothetical protein R3W88_030810 [Solanum pinnatisectum]